MAKVYAIEDKQARFPIALGRHTVRGTVSRYKTLAIGSDLQVTYQRVLGHGEWEQCEKLYYIQNEAATEITAGNFFFHPGSASDAPDTFFPDDIAHPDFVYDSIRLPLGLSADGKPENTIGIYKTLKIPDYSSLGAATPISFSANPARAAAELIRRTRPRILAKIDWGAWIEWRDWCAELINVTVDGSTVQIPRFEAHVFLIPPFNLSQSLDKLCQITCSDWQWRGGKIRFMAPVGRPDEYLFDLSKVSLHDFKYLPASRENRYNIVRIYYRDITHPYLKEAVPVEVRRQSLIDADGGIENALEINIGVAHRSQAERVANFWAKMRCDTPNFVSLRGQFDSFKVLPGDFATLTHDVPNWTNKRVLVVEKEEDEEKGLGYEFKMQIIPASAYSDTDQTPFLTSSDPNAPDPFSAPPVPYLLLEDDDLTLNDGTIEKSIKGTVYFGTFGFAQFAKILWTRPGKPEELCAEVTPDGSNQATFRIRKLPTGINYFRAIAFSRLGIANAAPGGVNEDNRNIASVDFQANGRINGLDPFGTPRGRDLAIVPQNAITSHIDYISIVNDVVDVLLGVSILDLGLDVNNIPIHNNSDSVSAVQVDVYNHFGEVVQSFTPAAANRIGGQIVCKFSRKYADLATSQGYFKIRVKNYFDYSLPVYLTGSGLSTTPPSVKLRSNSVLDAYAVPVSANSVRVFYQFSHGDIVLYYRKVDSNLPFTLYNPSDPAISSSPFLVTGLAEYTEYDFFFESVYNGFHYSNIFRAITKPQGEVAPLRPVPTGIGGAAVGQTQLDFTATAAANVETEVWVDGSLATTLSAVTVGQPINYSITGLTANTSRSVKMRHKWSGVDFSDFTEEVTKITNSAPPSETRPNIDWGYYDEINQECVIGITSGSGSGVFIMEFQNESGGWIVIDTGVPSNATQYNYFVAQDQYRQIVAFRMKRATTSLSPAYSNSLPINIPPADNFQFN